MEDMVKMTSSSGVFVNLSTGNVGIGTANPQAKLDVQGNVYVNGNVSTQNLGIFRNRIVNGDMRIDQRSNGAALNNVVNSVYALDRFVLIAAVASKFSSQQSSIAPPGFVNSFLLTSLSAHVFSGTQWFGFAQYIEAYNVSDFKFGTSNAETVTISFWVRSSVTGTYAVTIGNHNLSRSYVTHYNIPNANTFALIQISIPGDTSGTWISNTNGRGFRLWFDLGSSQSPYNTTVDTWVTGDYVRTSASSNWITTNGATFYITGVQLEKGTIATPFEFRPYPIELQLCQRYYQRDFRGSLAVNTDATRFTMSIKFVTSMRSQPSVTLISGTTFTVDFTQLANISVTPTNFRFIGLNGCTVYGTHDSLGATGHPGEYSSDNIQASAEL